MKADRKKRIKNLEFMSLIRNLESKPVEEKMAEQAGA
jgi:hypothetical protein